MPDFGDVTTPCPDWPDFLGPPYDYAPAYWMATPQRRIAWAAKHHQSLDLVARPRGILVHSGSSGENTAGWAHNPAAEWFAHFAYDSQRQVYEQTASLRARAPHGGILNAHAWGIESCHHPADVRHKPPRWQAQDGTHREQTVELVRRLVELGAEWVTAHRFVDREKRDPGPCVTADWFADMGLRVYWAWVGAESLLAAEGG